ncbi:MAG: hypothetical protein CL454_00780 [Acidimicrobiaceae bacterium]|nr:hypothetical protein [Acidimicrobiaceae bacterium]
MHQQLNKGAFSVPAGAQEADKQIHAVSRLGRQYRTREQQRDEPLDHKTGHRVTELAAEHTVPRGVVEVVPRTPNQRRAAAAAAAGGAAGGAAGAAAGAAGTGIWFEVAPKLQRPEDIIVRPGRAGTRWPSVAAVDRAPVAPETFLRCERAFVRRLQKVAPALGPVVVLSHTTAEVEAQIEVLRVCYENVRLVRLAFFT